jgi:enoyl-CoA hydratase/carnithine racemase
MGFEVTTTNGIRHLVMDNPPVNALTVAGWFELAELLTEAGRDPEVAVVILSAAGKGFNAGVDIKEMQNTEGFDALIGANRGCAAAFGAIYDCEVPVICAVHDFVLGGGIGLIGNADVIVAAEGTTIGLPEVKQGALGAATHLSRLVPPAPHASDGLYRRADRRFDVARVGVGGRGGATRRAVGHRRAHRRADRPPQQPGDPGGQGVAERHRSGRRAPQLTAWSRASRSSSTCPACPTRPATPSSRNAIRPTSADPTGERKAPPVLQMLNTQGITQVSTSPRGQQSHHSGRGDLAHHLGNDDRHRRLGGQAQAVGAHRRTCRPATT